ncbi:hypothetical protein [Terasakiella sp. SH-1]|uniref:hypothetical protein n=1 Tax=Terasakiella sp. SH-1 TaxID=2560057 RepID=UPI001074315E|nr:hypothetical protein [Terasakiella sp. SH-1]
METFQEYVERNGKGQDIQTLEEGFLNQVEREVLLIEKRIQAENDLLRKIDLLAKQSKWAAFLTVCSLAVQLKDISVLKRIRKN